MSVTTDHGLATLPRRAATTITEFAAAATPGSWNGILSTDGAGYGFVAGGPWEYGYRMGTLMTWPEPARALERAR